MLIIEGISKIIIDFLCIFIPSIDYITYKKATKLPITLAQIVPNIKLFAL